MVINLEARHNPETGGTAGTRRQALTVFGSGVADALAVEEVSDAGTDCGDESELDGDDYDPPQPSDEELDAGTTVAG